MCLLSAFKFLYFLAQSSQEKILDVEGCGFKALGCLSDSLAALTLNVGSMGALSMFFFSIGVDVDIGRFEGGWSSLLVLHVFSLLIVIWLGGFIPVLELLLLGTGWESTDDGMLIGEYGIVLVLFMFKLEGS